MEIIKILLFVVVLGITSYQVLLKVLGGLKVNAFLVFPIVYLTAFILSLILVISNKSINDIFSLNMNIIFLSVLLGAMTLIIEFSYFQAFKMNANISTFGMSAMIFSILVMVIIGSLFFNEYISSNKIIGIMYCIFGIFLIKLN